MALPAANFSLPANPQASSRLMQLPTELRLKILRLLMRDSRPITSCMHLSSFQNWSTTNECEYAHQYSTQLLSTCQHMYRDGENVFYEQNAVEIDFRGLSENELRCSILGWRIEMPRGLRGTSEEHLDIRKRAETHAVMRCNPKIGSPAMLSRICSRFMIYGVSIHDDLNFDTENMFIICHSVKDILFQKHVTFTLNSDFGPDPTEEIFISPCKLLRCASIKFQGFSNFDMDEVVNTIISNQAVVGVDTYKSWCLFRRDFLKKLHQNYDHCFDDEYPSLIESLLDRTIQCDFPGFRRLQLSIMKAAKKWNRQLLETQEDYRLQQAADSAKARIASGKCISKLIKDHTLPADIQSVCPEGLTKYDARASESDIGSGSDSDSTSDQ